MTLVSRETTWGEALTKIETCKVSSLDSVKSDAHAILKVGFIAHKVPFEEIPEGAATEAYFFSIDNCPKSMLLLSEIHEDTFDFN